MTDITQTIALHETGSKGRYLWSNGPGTPTAELTFSKTGDTIIILDHTAVPDAYRGMGIGAAGGLNNFLGKK